MLVIVACCAAAWRSGTLPAEEPKGNFEAHDLSLWILEPGSPQANVRTAYPSALPGIVNSARSGQPLPIARRIAPINLIRFFGGPAAALDVDLRTKSGGFLAHWPVGEGLPNRVRWAGPPAFDLVEKIEDESELAFVDADHWIRKAREGEALYVKRGARSERFLAYDAELTLPAPIRLEGGPEKYTVINTSDAPLYDVLISRATPQGRRVAWIDVLPKAATAGPATSKPTPKPALSLFSEASPPKPAAAGAPQEPAKDGPKDAATKDEAAKDKPAEKKPAAPNEKAAAKEAAAGGKAPPQLFGGLPSKPAAAEKASTKEAAAAGKAAPQLFGGIPLKPAVVQPPAANVENAAPTVSATGVEVTLSDPLPADVPETAAKTTQALGERLKRAGLRAQEVELFVDSYHSLFFEGEAVVVACRLDSGTIDAKIPLSVFPEPTKMIRVALVIVRNADPGLGTEVERLVTQLGDAKYAIREAAQKRLIELGPLAFGSLNKALSSADLEIVIRAERILLEQNQTPNPQPQAGQAVPGNPVKGKATITGTLVPATPAAK
jgi:hypothetical protein